MHQSPLDANLCRSECKKYKRNTTIRTGGRAAVVGQFDCHPEQALFAQRRIWASRATWRGFSATIIARLARFLVKRTHYQSFRGVEGFLSGMYNKRPRKEFVPVRPQLRIPLLVVFLASPALLSAQNQQTESKSIP